MGRTTALACTCWNLGSSALRILIYRAASTTRTQQAVVAGVGGPCLGLLTTNDVLGNDVLLGETNLSRHTTRVSTTIIANIIHHRALGKQGTA